jgi:hypothetical protein
MPEPTVDNDAVEISGITYGAEQVDAQEITVELNYNLEEDEQECNDTDADTSDTSDAPATSVMNTYLRSIQTRLKYEVLENIEDEEMWLTKLLIRTIGGFGFIVERKLSLAIRRENRHLPRTENSLGLPGNGNFRLLRRVDSLQWMLR